MLILQYLYLCEPHYPSHLAVSVQFDSFLMLNWQDIIVVIRCLAAGYILYHNIPFTNPPIRCLTTNCPEH